MCLASYSQRFWKRFIKDATPWARDNILWGVVVLAVPPIAAYIGHADSSIDWVLIRTSLWLYGLAFLIYALVHLCRTPEKLDIEAQGAIAQRDQAIRERDETIHTLTAPKRTAAEQHDYQTAQEALQLLGKSGVDALRYLRSQTRFEVGTYSSPPAPGMSIGDTLRVYNHCVSVGLVIRTGGGYEKSVYMISPKFEKIFEELLFIDNPAP
jgi:hypothetical protein